ncbi:Cof-type HAD-IIB family hydrolase [Priestia flexa]|uniref:Cof-type HAD-IIB family hydrolase n=1 Tax=Priestia flexa TaxID=86664 RepID=UPI001B3226FA|nr:Cof-type HAD-IIB family hydrolase [Priestia flexa]
MSCKIIFFDVDGTLTHHKSGEIPESTKRAISLLRNLGIIIVAATGRPLSMCEELKELGIDVFITANGGYVTYQNEVIHKVSMSKSNVKELVGFSDSKQHALSFYTKGFHMNGVQEEGVLAALFETLSLQTYPDTHPSIYEEEIYLLCLFGTDEVVDQYKMRFPHYTFRRWHPYVVNVLETDVSKSQAIVKVLEYFKIHPSEAMAFGDGDNDIDMLETVGIGVAMENGSQSLKEIADFVTKKSDEDGVEFALRHYNLISQ